MPLSCENVQTTLRKTYPSQVLSLPPKEDEIVTTLVVPAKRSMRFRTRVDKAMLCKMSSSEDQSSTRWELIAENSFQQVHLHSLEGHYHVKKMKGEKYNLQNHERVKGFSRATSNQLWCPYKRQFPPNQTQITCSKLPKPKRPCYIKSKLSTAPSFTSHCASWLDPLCKVA